jgi:hypothetical protein
MTDLPILTAPLDPVVDLAHYVNSGPDQRQHEDVVPRIIDKRAQARQEAAERAQVAKNVTNLAATNWWHAQAAEQRGDHVAAAQHGIARGRLLAAAKAQGLRLG